MARIRSVKPSLRTSRVVASWPFEVRYFWVLLWGYLDDKGRGLDLPRAIAADCYPLDEAVTPAKVDRWLTLMATTKLGTKPAPLCRYEVDGDRYIHSLNWDEHQKPNRPTPSVLPPCPVHEALSESPSSPHVLEEEGEEEVGGGGALTARPSPWCPRHPGGTDKPCNACRLARVGAEAFNPPPPDPGPACRHGKPASRCSVCRSEAIARKEPA